jgi:hypothetical protein
MPLKVSRSLMRKAIQDGECCVERGHQVFHDLAVRERDLILVDGSWLKTSYYALPNYNDLPQPGTASISEAPRQLRSTLPHWVPTPLGPPIFLVRISDHKINIAKDFKNLFFECIRSE